MLDALAAGAACDVTAQCATGLACVCGSGAGCPPAFVRGLCSVACTGGSCGVGATCALVALGVRSR